MKWHERIIIERIEGEISLSIKDCEDEQEVEFIQRLYQMGFDAGWEDAVESIISMRKN